MLTNAQITEITNHIEYQINLFPPNIISAQSAIKHDIGRIRSTSDLPTKSNLTVALAETYLVHVITESPLYGNLQVDIFEFTKQGLTIKFRPHPSPPPRMVSVY